MDEDRVWSSKLEKKDHYVIFKPIGCFLWKCLYFYQKLNIAPNLFLIVSIFSLVRSNWRKCNSQWLKLSLSCINAFTNEANSHPSSAKLKTENCQGTWKWSSVSDCQDVWLELEPGGRKCSFQNVLPVPLGSKGWKIVIIFLRIQRKEYRTNWGTAVQNTAAWSKFQWEKTPTNINQSWSFCCGLQLNFLWNFFYQRNHHLIEDMTKYQKGENNGFFL